MTYLKEYEYSFARQVVDLAKKSITESSPGNPHAKVAVIIAVGDRVVGWAAKGVGGKALRDDVMVQFDNEPKLHAEELLLKNMAHLDLSNAVAYVTLEPCTTKRKGTPCAQLLVRSGITTVFIGNSDPHPKISNASWKVFHNAGIRVRDFPVDLRNEARRDNIEFLRKFVYSPQEKSSASFNYARDNGSRVLGPKDKEFSTRWTRRSNGSIHAVDYENDVCVAKNCTKFEQIEDPSRWYEDSHYTKPVNAGEIVIFRNSFGYALIKIKEVTYPDEHGNGNLSFDYELRYLDEAIAADDE